MMTNKKTIIFGIAVLLAIAFMQFAISESISDSIPIQIQTLNDAGSVVTGTFTFKIDISNSSDCTPVLYSNTTNRTTDSRGIVTYNLEDVDLSFDEQYWFCYYRDGTLEDTIKAARVPYSFRAKNVSASGIVADSNLNFGDYNITASNFFGNIAQSINVSGNITIGDQITFTLGEIIDNLVDGLIKITGDLNVTGRIQDETGYITPAGSVLMFGGSTAPQGWLIANGNAVSRTTYADLFAVVGTTYGTGDGSTTFNLPNMTLRFPLGNNGSLGTKGGSATITTSNMPSHSHTVDLGGASTGTASPSTTSTTNPGTSSDNAHTHSISIALGPNAGTASTAYVGRGTATSSSTYSSFAGDVSSSDSHSHSLQSHTHSLQSHTHNIDVAQFSSATNGSSTAYWQPYTIVNYIIKY